MNDSLRIFCLSGRTFCLEFAALQPNQELQLAAPIDRAAILGGQVIWIRPRSPHAGIRSVFRR